MAQFGVLTNRKRVVVALVHSVIFLGIALHGFASPKAALSLHSAGTAAGIALLSIYGIVASVLAWLARIARCTRERVYFVMCTCSASFGFLRTIFGDSALPAAQYGRVLALTCAVAVGLWMVRDFSEEMVAE